MLTPAAPKVDQGLVFCFFEHLPAEILLLILGHVVTAPGHIVDPAMPPAKRPARKQKQNDATLVRHATTARSSRLERFRERTGWLPMFEQASENTSVWTPTLRVCQKWNAVGCRTLYENSTILFTNPKAQLSFVNTYLKPASLVQSMTFSMQYRDSPLFANATHNPKFADMPSRFPSLRRLALHFVHWEHLEQVYIATGSTEIGLMRRPDSGSFPIISMPCRLNTRNEATILRRLRSP